MGPTTETEPAAPAVADPMIPRTARVRARRRDAPQVWTVDIEEEESPAGRFQPGQFNMLTVFGVGEIPISLSGDPAVAGRLTHTIRSVGAVSRALTRLERGAVVGLRGPFGMGWPVAESAGCDVLIVAGGLGLAPLRPVLYHLRTERARYGRIVLLYGTRSPGDILFRRELRSWQKHAGIDVRITVDHAAAGWKGNVGVVTGLVPFSGCDPSRSVAFVCGPEVMMRLTIGALRGASFSDDRIYLSMERNMKCAVALCGRCQFSSVFICRDGPVFRYDRVRHLLTHKEL
jgi:NAD(P)H-flavin reductase